MKPNPLLLEFLQPYDTHIQQLCIDLRDYITTLIPEANELIWDNYNAVAIAFSKSEKLKDAFCHISVYSKHVNFGFNRGAEIQNPPIKLNGKGKLIRHISILNFLDFPKAEIEEIIKEAIAISDTDNPALNSKEDQGKSIVMSISEKKIRPK